MTKLLLIDEVADTLRCRHDQVLRLIASGDLDCVRLSRKSLRVKASSLDRLIG